MRDIAAKQLPIAASFNRAEASAAKALVAGITRTFAMGLAGTAGGQRNLADPSQTLQALRVIAVVACYSLRIHQSY